MVNSFGHALKFVTKTFPQKFFLFKVDSHAVIHFVFCSVCHPFPISVPFHLLIFSVPLDLAKRLVAQHAKQKVVNQSLQKSRTFSQLVGLKCGGQQKNSCFKFCFWPFASPSPSFVLFLSVPSFPFSLQKTKRMTVRGFYSSKNFQEKRRVKKRKKLLVNFLFSCKRENES